MPVTLEDLKRHFGPKYRWRPIKWYSSFVYGPPQMVVLHFTAGCGDPHQVLIDRTASVQFGLLRPEDGGWVDHYVDEDHYSWHNYALSRNAYGVELVAMPVPGGCEITEQQLENLAWVTAYLLDEAQKRYGKPIPTARSPGRGLAPGIKCHADSLGTSNNPNGHWDGPCVSDRDYHAPRVRSPWTYDQLIARVKQLRGEEEELTPEQEKIIAWAGKLKDGAERFPEGPMPKAGTTQRLGWDLRAMQKERREGREGARPKK